MRKLTLFISVTAAALMVTACGDPNKAAKDAATQAEAVTTEAPVTDAAATNSVDSKMAGDAATANNSADDERGGDPGAK